MIHSLAGGQMAELDYQDYVKVEILEGVDVGKKFWYKRGDIDLQLGDIVIVPLGYKNEKVNAKVIKIEENLSNQVAPVPSKRAKYIINKLEK